jgi:HAE1 family hydrophobic/amphiphilic exporter-1
VTIPVSLIGTFAFAKALGFSINTLTLFGHHLATGLVVDDAIVVIENIERFIQSKRMQARVAAREAMGEVFGAVVATTLVLVAVFVPVAFFPGVTGRIYKQFSLTLAFSVLLSLFMSVTLTPAMSALLLRQSHGQGRFFTAVNHGLERLSSGYAALLHRMLRFRFAFIAVLVAALAGPTSPFAWCPEDSSRRRTRATSSSPSRARTARAWSGRRRTILRAEQALHEFEEVQDVFRHRRLQLPGERAEPRHHVRQPQALGRAAQARVPRSPGCSRGSASGSAPSSRRRWSCRSIRPPIQGVGSIGGFPVRARVGDRRPGPAGQHRGRHLGGLAAGAPSSRRLGVQHLQRETTRSSCSRWTASGPRR